MSKLVEFSQEYWKAIFQLYDSNLLNDVELVGKIHRHRNRIIDFMEGRIIYGPNLAVRPRTIDFAADEGAYTTKPTTYYLHGGYVAMHEELPLPDGTMYFTPNPCYPNGYMRSYWHNTTSDKAYLKQGWVFLKCEDAQKYLKVLTPEKD